MPTAYFTARNSSGLTSLWVTDGTSAGTREVSGVVGANPTTGLNPTDLALLGDRVAFSGSDVSGQRGAWISDGTAAGTTELIPTAQNSYDFTTFGNRVLFFDVTLAAPAELHHRTYITDGTVGGTIELNDFVTSHTNSGDPRDLTVFGNHAIFMRPNGFPNPSFRDLWVTDGTAAGTHRMNVPEQFGSQLQPFAMTAWGDRALFAGQANTLHGNFHGFWITDGTDAGTTLLHDAGGLGSSVNGTDRTPLALGAIALFNGWIVADTHQLWSTRYRRRHARAHRRRIVRERP
jgi:ELWxxDGT repeat protein